MKSWKIVARQIIFIKKVQQNSPVKCIEFSNDLHTSAKQTKRIAIFKK